MDFLPPQLCEPNKEIRVMFPSSLPCTFFFLFYCSSDVSHKSSKVGKIFILIPALASNFVWPGERSLILILALSYVLEVSLANIFRDPFGIALKVALVWVIYLFKYLSSWVFPRWNWNSNLKMSPQKNSKSSNRKILSVTIEVFLVSLLDWRPPGFQILVGLWVYAG